MSREEAGPPPVHGKPESYQRIDCHIANPAVREHSRQLSGRQASLAAPLYCIRWSLYGKFFTASPLQYSENIPKHWKKIFHFIDKYMQFDFPDPSINPSLWVCSENILVRNALALEPRVYLDLLVRATTIPFMSTARPNYHMNHTLRLLFQTIYSHPSHHMPLPRLGEGQHTDIYCLRGGKGLIPFCHFASLPMQRWTESEMSFEWGFCRIEWKNTSGKETHRIFF